MGCDAHTLLNPPASFGTFCFLGTHFSINALIPPPTPTQIETHSPLSRAGGGEGEEGEEGEETGTGLFQQPCLKHTTTRRDASFNEGIHIRGDSEYSPRSTPTSQASK